MGSTVSKHLVTTYHAKKIVERSMHTKCFVYHRIEVREIVSELIIGRVDPKLKKLRSQFALDIRVSGEFN